MPGTFDDILKAIRYLDTLADPRLDTMRVSLMVHSAGGHLALLAASETQSLNVNISQVVALAAISDIEKYALGENSCKAAASEFLGGLPAERADVYIYFDGNSPGALPKTVKTWLSEMVAK